MSDAERHSVVNAEGPFFTISHRVYFTASILTAQWLAHTVHEIVTCSNPICHQVLYDRRVKLLITKSKGNKITPSHNHATLLLHHNNYNSFSRVKRETSLAARSEEKRLFSQARKTTARGVKKELIIRGSAPGPPSDIPERQ